MAPLSGLLIGLCAVLLAIPGGHAEDQVDTALVVSIDVSNSADDHRYQLQIAGIVGALEDPTVIADMLNGPHHGILFSMIEWSDKPRVAIPWSKIATRGEALAVAQSVRKLPRNEGEFTCMANMLRFVSDKIVTQIPLQLIREPHRPTLPIACLHVMVLGVRKPTVG